MNSLYDSANYKLFIYKSHRLQDLWLNNPCGLFNVIKHNQTKTSFHWIFFVPLKNTKKSLEKQLSSDKPFQYFDEWRFVLALRIKESSEYESLRALGNME